MQTRRRGLKSSTKLLHFTVLKADSAFVRSLRASAWWQAPGRSAVLKAFTPLTALTWVEGWVLHSLALVVELSKPCPGQVLSSALLPNWSPGRLHPWLLCLPYFPQTC